MRRENDGSASVLAELADLLELHEANRFRVLTYRRAADVVSSISQNVAELSQDELTAIRGIGKSVAAKIREYVETGTIADLEELRSDIPAGVRVLTELPGLGPKRAMTLYRALGVATLDDLRRAADQQRVREVKGFGQKAEENILRALDEYRGGSHGRRVRLDTALTVAEEMLGALEGSDAVAGSLYAGSLRRMRESIGDVDLLAASDRPSEVMELFCALPNVVRVEARGETKSTVLTTSGLQVDLRVVPPDAYGAALQYFTGSKAHNVAVREHAVRRGYKLSEYGLFRAEDDVCVASASEEEIYGRLGMAWIPPTLREDRGEVQAALAGELPTLVEVSDIRGDLQSHTTYSDGTTSVGDMARAAAARGYAYYAVTDHGRRLGMKSLSLSDIERQREEVRQADEELGRRMAVLHGVELNIGRDGELDYPDDVLEGFDVVVASIHHQMDQDAARITKRLLRAIEHPCVHIIGHPTGRRIGRRRPYEFDFEAVFAAAARHQVAVEVNASPERLDLPDEHVRWAREQGVRFVISTDAHGPAGLDDMRYGVATAQRGWVTPAEVINTWPLGRLRRFLAKR